jgi:DegV family protein with EDD domain
MKKFAITTDTNSGMLTTGNYGEGVFVLPMPFIIEGESYLECVDLSRETFYEKLLAGASVSTSQPSSVDVCEFWDNILKEYDQILHIPTSSKLSNSCETAKGLAKDYNGKVIVVDNLRISIALRQAIRDAITLREKGCSPEEAKDVLESMCDDHVIYLSVRTMEYLKRGGRISPAAAAIAGGLLKLKPVLKLHSQKMEKLTLVKTPAKAKDAIFNAVKNDLNGKFKEALEKGEVILGIGHGDAYEEAEAFKKEVEVVFPGIPVEIVEPVSLSIACHTGPDMLGLGIFKVVK